MSFVPPPSPDDPTPRCPHCGKKKRAVMSFEEHVEVIEGPGGAISTRTEQRLERYLVELVARELRSPASTTPVLPP